MNILDIFLNLCGSFKGFIFRLYLEQGLIHNKIKEKVQRFPI